MPEQQRQGGVHRLGVHEPIPDGRRCRARCRGCAARHRAGAYLAVRRRGRGGDRRRDGQLFELVPRELSHTGPLARRVGRQPAAGARWFEDRRGGQQRRGAQDRRAEPAARNRDGRALHHPGRRSASGHVSRSRRGGKAALLHGRWTPVPGALRPGEPEGQGRRTGRLRGDARGDQAAAAPDRQHRERPQHAHP